jgi:amino acid transporter
MTMDPGALEQPPVVASEPARRGSLLGNLTTWQVLGLSIGLMGLSLSANIDPQGAVPVVGRAIPLSFAIATVGVLLVSYGFIRLTQYFRHSGSVFGFVGATLGVRSGAVAGWALLGSYLCFGIASAIAGGLFGVSLLQNLGAWPSPPLWAPYLVSCLLLLGGAVLGIIPARRGTGLLLVFEAVTIVLMLAISVAVFIRVVGSGGPQGQHFTMSVFTPPSGVSPSAVFLGAVFGFLAFGGFEGAAALGEEAREPRRTIPRAILGAVVIGGVFYILTSTVEVIGFGTTAGDLARFHASGSLFGDLGTNYISAWAGDLVTAGTMVSAFGGATACGVGAARLIFAFARSAHVPGVAVVTRRWGTPARAVACSFGAMLLVKVVFGWLTDEPSLTMFTWTGTIGTLVILVAYLMATVGAIVLLVKVRAMQVPRWQLVIPVAAIAVLGYTIYRNVVPYPTGSAAWLPISAALWLALPLAAVIVRPRLVARIGSSLVQDEGLTPVGRARLAGDEQRASGL